MNEHVKEEQLNDFVDGQLSEAKRRDVLAHLESCQECREALARVERLVDALRGLPREGSPRRDLWAGVAEGTASRVRVIPIRRARPAWLGLSLSLPQAAAAAVAASIIGAAAVWLTLGGDARNGTPSSIGVVPRFGTTVSLATPAYDSLVTELTQLLDDHGGALDPATQRVIEENLRTIDAAIAEIEEALAEDPSDEFLNAYLARAMRRKLDVLRQTALLANRS